MLVVAVAVVAMRVVDEVVATRAVDEVVVDEVVVVKVVASRAVDEVEVEVEAEATVQAFEVGEAEDEADRLNRRFIRQSSLLYPFDWD